jgi:hypothetical protein
VLSILGCSSSGVRGSDAGRPEDASGDAQLPTSPPGMPSMPFTADPPAIYVAKVKNVLVGLPPTDDEVAQVSADPKRLAALIDGWMKLPEYQTKMLRFFELAFQQTQVSSADYTDQFYPKKIAFNDTTEPLILQNAEESLARTVLQLTAEGRPLTEALTTRRFMLTTALKELYGFLDVWEIDNGGKITDRFRGANPSLSIFAESKEGPIPIAETLDPTSPNYMHWYDQDVATANADMPACVEDPIVFPGSAITLHYLLYGSLDIRKAGSTKCSNSGGSPLAPQLTADDFSDWTMVAVREPKADESVTPFYDLPALRKANEIVLTIPRVGFFSTPAFFANWQTNVSNQMRVTLNQTLIVALGSSIDGTDSTTPTSMPPPGLDEAHAGSSDCLFCHQTLDPLRSIFSANYSWNYHNQLDTQWRAQKGVFSFRGVSEPVTSMLEFGEALARHPLFAEAWTQKLCYFVNSAPCASSDQELQRVVAAFRDSSFDWNTLVRELASSPITTHAERTASADASGEVVAVARRDHLCAALDNRLGFSDVCGLHATTRAALRGVIPAIAQGLPSDGYGRGSTAPVLPNRPTLFFRAGTENLCATAAQSVIDVRDSKRLPNVKQWSSNQPDAAIADFVAILLAMTPSDPRAAQATSLLKAHFTNAMQQGATATNALKSTFTVACLSPSFVSIGM